MIESKSRTLLKVIAILFLAPAGQSAFGDPDSPPQKHMLLITGDAPAADEKNESPNQPELIRDALPPGAIARLGSINWQIQGELADCLVVTADGKNLVTANRQDGIAWWSMDDGLVRKLFPGAANRKAWFPAQSVALSADGNRAAIVDGSANIHILDLPSGAEVASHDSPIALPELAMSKNGSVLAARSTKGRILLWEIGREPWHVDSGDTIPFGDHRFKGPFPNGEIAISADGKVLAWVSLDRSRPIHVYDVVNRTKLGVFEREFTSRRFITVSPDGTKLASLSGGKEGIVWDIETRKVVLTLPHKGTISTNPVAAFSPDGKSIGVHVAGTAVSVIDLDSGKLRWSSPNDRDFITRQAAVTFTPDSKTLLLNAHDPIINRYNAADGKTIAATKDDSGGLHSLTFSKDGKHVYSLNGDSTLRKWEVAKGKEVRKTTLKTTSGKFSPDGRLVAAVRDQETYVYDVESCQELWHSPENYFYCFSDDGTLLVLAKGTGFLIRDAKSGKERRAIQGLNESIHTAVVSPDNRRLYVNSGRVGRGLHFDSGRLQVWDIDSGLELTSIPMPPNGGEMELSPDGKTMAFLCPGGTGFEKKCSIELQEMATGKSRLRCEQLDLLPFAVQVHFAPGGNVVTGDIFSRDLIFCDLDAGRIRCRLNCCSNGVRRWTFSPDGKYLGTVGNDSTALIWDFAALPVSKPVRRQSEADLATLWKDLASSDAAKAYQAIRQMTDAGERSLPMLSKLLVPIPGGDEKQIDAWISQLGNDRYATREQALKELEKCGDCARPALARELSASPNPETSRRIRSILSNIDQALELIRPIRAIEVVERIGTPKAQQILQDLANGKAGTLTTTEAKASLGRLTRK